MTYISEKSIKNSTILETIYTYYADGLRESKTNGADTTVFYYDNGNVRIETQNGNLCARNIQGINTIARQAGTNTQYYLYKGHGDVVQLNSIPYLANKGFIRYI